MPKAKKLPSGSWRCQVFSHYEYTQQSDGTVKKKRIYESFTSSNPTKKGKAEAEAAAAEWKAHANNRKNHIEMTIYDAISEYIKLKEPVLSVTTIQAYKSHLRTAYSDICGKKISRISSEDMQVWMNKFSASHSPKTCRNVFNLLTASIKMYAPDIHISVTMPERIPVEYYTPTDEDIKKLLNVTDGTELEKAILLSAFGTLRRGEIFALTIDDVNFENNTITINKSMACTSDGNVTIKTPKNRGSYRVIEYPDFVIDKFKGCEGNLVKMNMRSIENQFPSALKKAGVHRFRFHDLRAYSASIMHALGIPDAYIMRRGGWSSDGVLKRVYRRTISDEDRKFSMELNEHFSDIMQHEMQHENGKSK